MRKDKKNYIKENQHPSVYLKKEEKYVENFNRR